jgi:hypothetical protein
MRRAAKGFLPVVAGILFSIPAFADDTPMSGPEIEAALTDRTAIYDGGVIKQYFSPSGATPYWDGTRLTKGSWRVSGDQYCSIWPPSSNWSCYEMVRNSDGAVVWVGSRGDRYTAHLEDGNRMPDQ